MTSEKVVAVSRYKHEASMRDSYLYAGSIPLCNAYKILTIA